MKAFFFTLTAILAWNFVIAEASGKTIDTSAYPTIGDPRASVQVVVFVEPKCPHCKKYNNTVFPKIESDFIKTNKIRYTEIVTSFLPHSNPIGTALLCAYHQDPSQPNADLFFKYLNYMYLNQPPETENWGTVETLQKFASKASPAIDLDKLKDCIQADHYSAQLKENTNYGVKLLKGLSTPALLIDGVKFEPKDHVVEYKELAAAIQKALDSKKTK